MKNKLIILPIGLSLMSAYMESLWMTLAAVLLMFIIVAVVPICKNRESLYVFVLCFFMSIPINYFVLNKYDSWINFTLVSDGSRGLIYYLYLLEYMMILSSIEEIVIAIIARAVWKEQMPITLSIEEENIET